MRTYKQIFGKLFTMPPSLQELTQRCEVCCDRIQDSILIIEANTGGDRQFSFDLNATVAGITTCDLNAADDSAKRCILLYEEYRRIIKNEKSRRNIQRQITSLSNTIQLRQNLKEARQKRSIASNPYSRPAPSEQEASNTPVTQ